MHWYLYFGICVRFVLRKHTFRFENPGHFVLRIIIDNAPPLPKLAETMNGRVMPEQCPQWDFAPAEQISGAEDSRFCQLPLSLFLTAVSPDGGKI